MNKVNIFYGIILIYLQVVPFDVNTLSLYVYMLCVYLHGVIAKLGDKNELKTAKYINRSKKAIM